MSNEYDGNEDQDTPLVKKLRDELKSRDKLIEGLTTKVGEFESAMRKQTLAQVIESKGLNPKIAGIVPKDLQDDALDEWLTEYAEVFGGPTAGSQQDPNAAVAAEASRMAMAQQGASSGNPGDPLTRINEAQNWDELNAVLKAL